MTEQNNEPKITTASEYKKMFTQQLKVITLPSGASFKIRKLTLMDFLTTVVVPSGLISDDDLKEWSSKTEQERIDLATKNLTPETNENMVRRLIVASLVEPKVVESDPKDDELLVEDITADPLDSVILVQELLAFNGLDKGFKAGVRPFC